MAASALMEVSKKAHYSSYGDQLGAFKDDLTEAMEMVLFFREKLQDKNHGFLKR